MSETPLGPSTSGSVVLELGPGIGALVLHTPPELDGAEIEITPVGQAQDPAGHWTHSQVRQRITPGGTQFAAVYPGLRIGDYTVWQDRTTAALTVTIESGQVTSAKWPGL